MEHSVFTLEVLAQKNQNTWKHLRKVISFTYEYIAVVVFFDCVMS